MADSKAIAARVHRDVHEWLKQEAENRGTTMGSLVEEILRGAYNSQSSIEEVRREDRSASQSAEELPDGVYRPDSHKYEYAVKFRDNDGETDRKYYKTRKKAVEAAERYRESDFRELLRA